MLWMRWGRQDERSLKWNINGKTYIAPRRKNLQLSREKQRKLEVGQRQSRQARPVGKLLKFSRTHPLSSAWMGLKQVRKQSYCYEGCHVTAHCLRCVVCVGGVCTFWGKNKCGFVGVKDMCLIFSYKSYLSLGGWKFTAKILCPMSRQQNDCSLVSVIRIKIRS